MKLHKFLRAIRNHCSASELEGVLAGDNWVNVVFLDKDGNYRPTCCVRREEPEEKQPRIVIYEAPPEDSLIISPGEL